MRLLVCGSRTWTDREALRAWLDKTDAAMGPIEVVIHGAARGADSMAGEWARDRGKHEIACPADWRRHGKAAGPIRNREMLEHQLDLVIAFRVVGQSRGTDDMLRAARKAGIQTATVQVPPTPDSAVSPQAKGLAGGEA